MLDEQERITFETVASWKDYVHSLYVLMQAGEADRATVSLAEASRASAEASLLSLQQQIAETENSLSSVLGEVSHPYPAREPEQSAVSSTPVYRGTSRTASPRRPDIRQAEAALKQAFYATNQARAAFYPSITLSGSAGWTNNGGAVVTKPGELAAASHRVFGTAYIQSWAEHCQSENSEGTTGRSLAHIPSIAARCRKRSE